MILLSMPPYFDVSDLKIVEGKHEEHEHEHHGHEHEHHGKSHGPGNTAKVTPLAVAPHTSPPTEAKQPDQGDAKAKAEDADLPSPSAPLLEDM